ALDHRVEPVVRAHASDRVAEARARMASQRMSQEPCAVAAVAPRIRADRRWMRSGRDAVRGATRVPLAMTPASAGPAASTGAEVEAEHAGGAVVAGGDVAVGDVVAVDVRGVDDRTGDGGASGPHRRRRACSTHAEPPRTALIGRRVV